MLEDFGFTQPIPDVRWYYWCHFIYLFVGLVLLVLLLARLVGCLLACLLACLLLLLLGCGFVHSQSGAFRWPHIRLATRLRDNNNNKNHHQILLVFCGWIDGPMGRGRNSKMLGPLLSASSFNVNANVNVNTNTTITVPMLTCCC